MKEKLINSETAKLAKERGFNVPVWNYVDIDGEENSLMGYIGDSFEEKLDSAKEFIQYYLPAQSLLQKWLREVHKLIVHVECNYYDNELGWSTYSVTIFHKTCNKTTECFYNTYEEALEIGLQEGLKLIKI